MTKASTNTKQLEQQLDRVHKPHWVASKWFVLSIVSFATLGLGTGASAWSYDVAQSEVILPRVSVGGVNISGKTLEQATEIVQAAADAFLAEPFVFFGAPASGGERKKFELTREDLGLEIDVPASIERAVQLGHDTNHFKNAADQVTVAFGGGHLPLAATFDHDLLEAAFDTSFLSIEEPAKNARLTLKEGKLSEVESAYGMEIVRGPVYETLQDQAETLSHEEIDLTLGPTAPDLQVTDLAQTHELARELLKAEINFYYKDKNYSPSPEELASWLEFRSIKPVDVIGKAACNCGLPEKKKKRGEADTQLDAQDEDFTVPAMVVTPFDQARLGEKPGDPFYVLLMPENFYGRDLRKTTSVVGLNRDKVQHWLLSTASAELDVPGTNARLAFEKGKVKVTSPSKAGIGVDTDLAIHDLAFSIATGKPEIKLVLHETKPAINEGIIDELGITTKIASGWTDSTNSSYNRIYNINRGFELLSGLVIAPGQEFSTIESIAPIDGYNGYVQELVITGNKIRPEYGGGLCQVGSTLFRAAMDAGFEITERENHAFEVSHYIAPYPDFGVEATLYDNHPDLRFINDTGGYVLLMAYLDDNLIAHVDMYGTDPGRTTTIDGPYRLSGAPYAGGSTTFTYTVTDDESGEIVRQREFVSNFQPASKFKLTR